MAVTSWLKWLEGQRRPSKALARLSRFTPRLDVLEDRTVPAIFVVNTTTDTIDVNLGDGLALDAAGNTSLRAATMEANALAGPDLISFSPRAWGTITLESELGELQITDDLSITGPGARLLAVSGGDANRVFNIGPDAGVTIARLKVTHGLADGESSVVPGLGGGILNQGELTLRNVVVSHNTAQGDPDVLVEDHQGVGGGGGVANLGTLTVVFSRFLSNQALGGDSTAFPVGPDIAFPGMGIGGGLYNALDATATVSDSAFVENLAQGGSNCTGVFAGLGQGGGLYNDHNLTVSRTSFIRNRAIGGDHIRGPLYSGSAVGGGISSGSDEGRFPGSTDTAVLAVNQCRFVGNQAQGGIDNAAPAGSGVTGASAGLGGGLFVFQGSATIRQSYLYGNQALGGTGVANQRGGIAGGGGILFINFIGKVDALVDGCFIVANQAIGGDGTNAGAGGDALGGGLAAGDLNSGPFSLPGGTVTIANTLVSRNLAQGGAGGPEDGNGGNAYGGGIYNDSDSTMTATRSLIILNRARGGEGQGTGSDGEGIGGGVYNLGDFTDILTLIALNDASTSHDNCFGC